MAPGVTREPGPKKRIRGGCLRTLRGAGTVPGSISAYRRAGRRGACFRRPFRWLPLGHGTRRRQLHHQPPRRDDDEAAHGGFGGPEHEQHGAVEGLGNPRHRRSPSSPSMANRAATILLSASLWRLRARHSPFSSPSCFLPLKNITGTYELNRNRLSSGIYGPTRMAAPITSAGRFSPPGPFCLRA